MNMRRLPMFLSAVESPISILLSVALAWAITRVIIWLSDRARIRGRSAAE